MKISSVFAFFARCLKACCTSFNSALDGQLELGSESLPGRHYSQLAGTVPRKIYINSASSVVLLRPWIDDWTSPPFLFFFFFWTGLIFFKNLYGLGRGWNEMITVRFLSVLARLSGIYRFQVIDGFSGNGWYVENLIKVLQDILRELVRFAVMLPGQPSELVSIVQLAGSCETSSFLKRKLGYDSRMHCDSWWNPQWTI